METKTYYDRDLSVILDQVKQELGSDAIIVKSRKTKRKGFLGMFQKPVYEVVVSYDPEDLKKQGMQQGILHERSPLSDFGREAEKRLGLVPPQKPKKAGHAPPVHAIEKQESDKDAEAFRPEGRVFESGEFAPESFFELMEIAGKSFEEPPALTTPDLKLGAYKSMAKKEEAAARPSPASIPDPAGMNASQRRAKEIMDALEAEKKRTEREKLLASTKSEVHANAPQKRKRGRPRKHPLPAHLHAESVQIHNAPSEKKAPESAKTSKSTPEEGAELVSRLDIVEQMLIQLMGEMQKPQMQQASAKQQEPPAAQDETQDPDMCDIGRYKDMLLRQDVDFPVVDALLAMAVRYKRHENMPLDKALSRALREVLGKPRYLRGSTKTARTVMLIGPTGVGKTTTLVKLAAGCMFERKAKVAMINADVFRVGAQDQLNAYAKILDVPLKTVYKADELKKAIDDFGSMDFIFIDTCGKASNDADYQNEIRELLKFGGIQDIYLVTSSTTSGRVIRQIVESYSFIKQYKTILTKIDESGSVGGAVNLCYYSGQPLSYVTIGQNVPDDISKVDIETVVAQLLR